MTQQQTLWHKHEPVVSVQRSGEVIKFCVKCGLRL